MDLREQEITSEQIFKGQVVDLSVRTVALPNGKAATREIAKHRPAAAATAIDFENKMLLAEQWCESIKDLTLGVPTGLIGETDASPFNAMKREPNEEGGLKAEYWEKVSEFYSSVGFYDERTYLFYCDTLTRLEDERSLDEDEFLTTHRYNLSELKQLLSEGEIVDVRTVCAITVWGNMILSGSKENNDREKNRSSTQT